VQGAHQRPFIEERFRTDPRFRLEIEYCAEKAIPHSEFLEWSEDDQEKAMVWLTDTKTRCPDCGTREDEWDPKKGGSLHAYHVSSYICINCKNVEDEYEDARIKEGKRKGSLPAGFKVRLISDYIWQQRKRLRRQKQILATHQEAEDKRRQRLGLPVEKATKTTDS
jgi:DNA-directed RNA polymerase subunit RPC12/RpoP